MILPEGRSFELSQELLKGSIDIHVHAGRARKPTQQRKRFTIPTTARAADDVAGIRVYQYKRLYDIRIAFR